MSEDEITDKELWTAFKEESRSLKEANKSKHTQDLIDLSIPFESKNFGYHLIIDGKVDYWPSTGKWFVRDSKKKGSGFNKMIKELGNEI